MKQRPAITLNWKLLERSAERRPDHHYLQGEPRVHIGELKLFEGDWNDSDQYLHHGEPFSGLAWDEVNGRLWEAEIREGVLHGREVYFQYNGMLATDNLYENDELISGYCWDDLGRISEFESTGTGATAGVHYKYKFFAGDLVEEQLGGGENSRTRYFYPNGAIQYEDSRDTYAIFAPDQQVAFYLKKYSQLDSAVDAVVKGSWRELLWRYDGLIFNIFFSWLNSRLDQGDTEAKAIVFALTDHAVVKMAEEAIHLIGKHGYTEAIPLITGLLQSDRAKAPGEGGYWGTTAQIAEQALLDLTVPASEREAVRAALYKRHAREEQERKARTAEQAERERLSWAKAEASYYKTRQYAMTIKRSAKLFAPPDLPQEYHDHEYRFRVNGRTFSAFDRNAASAHPEADRHIVEVRYNANYPAENLIVNGVDQDDDDDGGNPR